MAKPKNVTAEELAALPAHVQAQIRKQLEGAPSPFATARAAVHRQPGIAPAKPETPRSTTAEEEPKSCPPPKVKPSRSDRPGFFQRVKNLVKRVIRFCLWTLLSFIAFCLFIIGLAYYLNSPPAPPEISLSKQSSITRQSTTPPSQTELKSI